MNKKMLLSNKLYMMIGQMCVLQPSKVVYIHRSNSLFLIYVYIRDQSKTPIQTRTIQYNERDSTCE